MPGAEAPLGAVPDGVCALATESVPRFRCQWCLTNVSPYVFGEDLGSYGIIAIFLQHVQTASTALSCCMRGCRANDMVLVAFLVK